MRYLGTDWDRSVEDSLTSYLPKYYQNSNVVSEIKRVDAIELESLYATADDVFAQFFVDTATWGLDKWETILNIKIDESKPYDQRRSVIKSKLRSYGVSTFDLIKSVAEAYLNGEVEVQENLKNFVKNFNDSGWISNSSGAFVVNDNDDYNVSLTAPDTNPIYKTYDITPPPEFRTFTASISLNEGITYIRELDSLSNVLVTHTLSASDTSVSFTTNSNTTKIRFEINSNSIAGTLRFTQPMLELGSTPTEFQPYRDYQIGIKFIGKRGNPPNIDDIKNAIRQVTPAHLAIQYILTYVIWDEIESLPYLWSTMDSKTWNDVQGSGGQDNSWNGNSDKAWSTMGSTTWTNL